MKEIKQIIIGNVCYTELVYERINKKLGEKLSKKQIESSILEILSSTDEKNFLKIGKNFYITNM